MQSFVYGFQFKFYALTCGYTLHMREWDETKVQLEVISSSAVATNVRVCAILCWHWDLLDKSADETIQFKVSQLGNKRLGGTVLYSTPHAPTARFRQTATRRLLTHLRKIGSMAVPNSHRLGDYMKYPFNKPNIKLTHSTVNTYCHIVFLAHAPVLWFSGLCPGMAGWRVY